MLGSADEFVRSYHYGVDYFSEISDRLGIARPTDYIIGSPLQAYAGAGTTTITRGLINARPKGNEFWDSLHVDPPVRWCASIYCFPPEGTLIDAREHPGHPLVKRTGAGRFGVTQLKWVSLAFTLSPINTAIRGYARVMSDAQDIRRAA